MEKSGVAVLSPGPRTGILSQWARTFLVASVALVLLALAAWTVVLHSVKLVTLQDRISRLESQCQLSESNIQQYIQDTVDKLVKQVRNREKKGNL